MKYLVISRTVTNGGDHLIAKKLMEVIKKEKANDELIYKSGTEEFDINYVNAFDGIIIGGGPLYENRLLNEDSFPLLKILSEINIPITIVGAGWYGSNGLDQEVFSYRFSEDAMKLYNKVISSGGYLGCRDYITTRVLKNNGLKNVLMTGCPVWYDYDRLEETKLQSNVDKGIKKIAISDPGITKKKEDQDLKSAQAIEVIKMIQQRFPHAKIIFTFNNGIKTKYSSACNMKIKNYLDSQGIEVFDLANDYKGFQVYDDIDLHVGYRVHSHIYTLSKRIPSILIEEDARGYGTNHALGLGEGLTSFDMKNMLNGKVSPNKSLLVNINNIITETIESDFVKMENAFNMMKKSYQTMKFQLDAI